MTSDLGRRDFTLIKRLAEPEDVAGPVAFFASADAFVTSEALVVDGALYKIS